MGAAAVVRFFVVCCDAQGGGAARRRWWTVVGVVIEEGGRGCRAVYTNLIIVIYTYINAYKYNFTLYFFDTIDYQFWHNNDDK